MIRNRIPNVTNRPAARGATVGDSSKVFVKLIHSISGLMTEFELLGPPDVSCTHLQQICYLHALDFTGPSHPECSTQSGTRVVVAGIDTVFPPGTGTFNTSERDSQRRSISDADKHVLDTKLSAAFAREREKKQAATQTVDELLRKRFPGVPIPNDSIPSRVIWQMFKTVGSGWEILKCFVYALYRLILFTFQNTEELKRQGLDDVEQRFWVLTITAGLLMWWPLGFTKYDPRYVRNVEEFMRDAYAMSMPQRMILAQALHGSWTTVGRNSLEYQLVNPTNLHDLENQTYRVLPIYIPTPSAYAEPVTGSSPAVEGWAGASGGHRTSVRNTFMYTVSSATRPDVRVGSDEDVRFVQKFIESHTSRTTFGYGVQGVSRLLSWVSILMIFFGVYRSIRRVKNRRQTEGGGAGAGGAGAHLRFGRKSRGVKKMIKKSPRFTNK